MISWMGGWAISKRSWFGLRPYTRPAAVCLHQRPRRRHPHNTEALRPARGRRDHPISERRSATLRAAAAAAALLAAAAAVAALPLRALRSYLAAGCVISSAIFRAPRALSVRRWGSRRRHRASCARCLIIFTASVPRSGPVSSARFFRVSWLTVHAYRACDKAKSNEPIHVAL